MCSKRIIYPIHNGIIPSLLYKVPVWTTPLLCSPVAISGKALLNNTMLHSLQNQEVSVEIASGGSPPTAARKETTEHDLHQQWEEGHWRGRVGVVWEGHCPRPSVATGLEVGVVLREEGPQQVIKLYSPPTKADVFFRRSDNCSLEITCNFRRSPGHIWRMEGPRPCKAFCIISSNLNWTW